MKEIGEVQADCPSDRAHQEKYLSGLIAEALDFLELYKLTIIIN